MKASKQKNTRREGKINSIKGEHNWMAIVFE